MALRPRRFQFGFASGSRARRAGIGLLPICCFQASGLAERDRLALKPTPSVVLGGGSAIIVVIRLSPLTETVPKASVPKGTKSIEIRRAMPVRGYVWDGVARIGLSYYRRELANAICECTLSRTPSFRGSTRGGGFGCGRANATHLEYRNPG